MPGIAVAACGRLTIGLPGTRILGGSPRLVCGCRPSAAPGRLLAAARGRGI